MKTSTLPAELIARGTVRPPRAPRLPFRHEDLFREAAYTDGQPYADGSETEDDGERW